MEHCQKEALSYQRGDEHVFRYCPKPVEYEITGTDRHVDTRLVSCKAHVGHFAVKFDECRVRRIPQ